MSWEAINASADEIRRRIEIQPTLGLVLGSGLGAFAETLENPVKIPYAELTDFPVSTVEGHAGQFVVGTKKGVAVIAMQGRVHSYEGFSPQQVVFPLRTMWKLGVNTVILTNATGGVNPSFAPGDLMLINDHINFTGKNPLTGPNDERVGPRFPPMSSLYTPELRDMVKKVARYQGVKLHEGVYFGVNGPNYETAAEIRMIRAMGGDVVGMSTVHEAIVAKHLSMRLIGISCVTNKAEGLPGAVLDHNDVQEVAAKSSARFTRLINGVLEALAEETKNALH